MSAILHDLLYFILSIVFIHFAVGCYDNSRYLIDSSFLVSSTWPFSDLTLLTLLRTAILFDHNFHANNLLLYWYHFHNITNILTGDMNHSSYSLGPAIVVFYNYVSTLDSILCDQSDYSIVYF